MRYDHLKELIMDKAIRPEIRLDAWFDLVNDGTLTPQSFQDIFLKIFPAIAVDLCNYHSHSEVFEFADGLIKWWVNGEK